MVDSYYSNQQVFDIVVKHLSKMKTQSIIIDSSPTDPICYYRSQDGNKCAIGCLIPDELYDPEMDQSDLGGGLFYVMMNFPKIEKLFQNISELLLYRLQSLHDEISNWDDSGFINVKLLFDIAQEFALSDNSIVEYFSL